MMIVVVTLAVGLVLLAFCGPLIVSADPNATHVADRLQSPSWVGGHGGLLGTDELGRSLALRVMFGLRTSYIVAISAVLLATLAGVAVGLAAGYYGRWIDSIAMRAVDVQLSLPGLLLVIAVVALVGGGVVVLVVVLALNSWMVYARVVRNLTQSLRHTEFVSGLTAIGAGPGRILWRHVLPSTSGAVVAVMTLELARTMLAEASLSFLGLGVQPPTVSLGAILADGRDYLATQWWVTTLSGVVLALAVLTANLSGSWLRDVIDPMGRSRVGD
jgi:peptide/nickel transport system permease protein